jgi:hypothetical protein
MPRALSLGLRIRILAALARGLSRRAEGPRRGSPLGGIEAYKVTTLSDCFEGQLDLDPERLVFVDETWASTKARPSRLYFPPYSRFQPD